jgi:hypothetical protein
MLASEDQWLKSNHHKNKQKGVLESRVHVLPKHIHYNFTYLTQLNSMAWVHERTIPIEQLPLVGEVSANFCG